MRITRESRLSCLEESVKESRNEFRAGKQAIWPFVWTLIDTGNWRGLTREVQ